jgi:hypothetical protein
MKTFANAISIKDFCESYSISRSLFYKLAREGMQGIPRTLVHKNEFGGFFGGQAQVFVNKNPF